MHRRIFQVFLFLLPTQLAYHIWPEWALFYGIRVDYLSIRIYLTQILIILIYLFWGKGALRALNRYKKWILILVVPLAINALLASGKLVSFFSLLNFFYLFLIGFYVSQNWGELKRGAKRSVFLSLLVVCLIAFGQLLRQRSLGGFLYFLGERSFSKDTIGIALVQLLGREFLRPYSIFSHPNSMAGFALASGILGIGISRKFAYKALFLFLSVGVVILSFSKGAILALGVLIAVYLIFGRRVKKVVHLGFLFSVFVSFASLLSSFRLIEVFSSSSEWIYRRFELLVASFEIFCQHPLVGVGLSNFIPALSGVEAGIVSKGTIWWLQPVHNIFVLLLVEFGIIGFLVVVYFLLRFFSKSGKLSGWIYYFLIVIMITGLLDHYWLTLWQNQLLLSIVLGVIIYERDDKNIL